MAKKGILELKAVGDASDLNKMVTGIHNKLGGLTSTVGKLAGAFGAMYAVKQVADFLGESAKAAMEDAKAKEILHTAIVNITKATEGELAALDRYIEKTQAATGFTEEELRPAMVKLTEATKDVGKAQEILAIAMDTAKARGVSLETVTLALEKAQNGSLMSLQRLGVATKDAAGATLSYDQILKNLAATYGGATAAAADTFAGKMERMKLVFGEIKEKIGAAMLPALEKIATVITDNMPIFERMADTFGTLIGGALDVLAKFIIPALQKAFEVAWPIIQDAVKVVFDFFKDNKEIVMEVFNAIGKIVETLGGIFKQAWEVVIKPAVKTAFDFFTDNKDTIIGLFSKIGEVVDALKPIFTKVFELVGKVTSALGPVFLGVLGAAVDIIATLVGWLADAITKVTDFLSMGSKNPSASNPYGRPWTVSTPGGPGNTGSFMGYATGGIVSRPSLVAAGESGPERVLSAHQTQLFERMVAALETGRGGRFGNITIYATANSGAELGGSIASSLAAVGAV